MTNHDSDTAVPQSNATERLTDTSPETAVQLYLDARRDESATETIKTHESRLSYFLQWCNKKGIENTNTLTGRMLYEYRLWRKNEGDINTVTLRSQISTVRTFIEFLETVEAVPTDLHEKIVLPKLDDGEGVRDTIISADRANDIRDYLRTYEYASFDHALFEVVYHTGCRIGEARALDVDDFHPRNQTIDVKHRPRGHTPLKNKQKGERIVALSDTVTDIISDYIDVHRHDTTDDHGRDPLFSSTEGRTWVSWLRRTLQRTTEPCLYGPCPHDRDPDDCEARGYDKASKCPSTVTPHDIRRSSITHMLNKDVPKQVVSDRMDVNEQALEKHYDQRTKEEKMEVRRKYINDV